MFASLFAVIAGTAPVALLCTVAVLLAARLRREPWPWSRAAAIAAGVSATMALLLFGVIAFVFAGGLRLDDGLAAAAGGGVQAALYTGLVALGSRIVDRYHQA